MPPASNVPPIAINRGINSTNNGEIIPATPSPILILKELVAKLYREQNKVHDLLGAMGYALRSLHNLNQFLELTPLMATR